jgi:hypothetical protein
VSCSQPRTSYLWCATFRSPVILLILTMLDWITCRITTYLLNSSSEFGEQSWLCSKHVLLTAVIPHFCGFLYICWSVSSLVTTFWAFVFVLGICIHFMLHFHDKNTYRRNPLVKPLLEMQ